MKAAFLMVTCVLSVAPAMLRAQTAASATVLGTVRDPSQAVVPGADVKLENRAINFAATHSTNTSGQYVFPGVPPGTYTIAVQMKGFRTSTVADLKVDVAKSYTVDFQLELGQVSEVVQVEAGARVDLQTTDATIGNVLPGAVLQRLGNLTRSAVEFLTLQPGVMPATGANTGGAVTGSRSDQSTFSLDGIDITENSIGGGGNLQPIIPIQIETVEEFRVGVANPNATFGRSAGGQVAVVSRRGSNAFHGQAFWTHQNDNLNANSWTNNRNKIKKAELKDNRFGGSFGGPIWRGKTFVYGSYFGRRFPQTFDIARAVPSDTLRQGILRFRDAAGNIVSYNLASSMLCGSGNNQKCDPRGLGISPTVVALWKQLPAANDLSSGDQLNTQGFRSTVGAPLKTDTENFRLDHNFTSKWRFGGSYIYSRTLQSSASQLDIRNGQVKAAATLPGRQDAIITNLVGEITPHLTSTFRFGFVRDRNNNLRTTPAASATELAISGTNTAAGFVALLQGPGSTGLSNLLSGGLDSPVDVDTQRARTQGNINKNFQYVEDMSWIKGTHTFQFGANVRHLPTLHLRNDKVVGSLSSLVALLDKSTFTTIPDTARPPTCSSSVTINCLASGDVSQWNRLYAATLGITDRVTILTTRDGSLKPQPFGTPLIADTTLNAYEFYFQDTWRVRPSLTFTYGLAYQWQTPPKEKDGKQTLLIDKATGEFINSSTYLAQKRQAALQGQVFNPDLAYVPIGSSGRGNVFDIDRNNWGPRLSAAWNPSFQDGVLGRLFGDRKTVVRGGFGIVYDRINTVQSVIIPTLGVGFAQTISINGPKCNATGAGGTGCNTASGTFSPENAFRVGVDGNIPLPTVPAASIPIVPKKLFSELLSFQVDPKAKVGMNKMGDLTIQRELPWNLLLEVGWAGRWASNLNQSKNLNGVPFFFKDPKSGQSFAQAFDALATQIRSGVKASAVTPQPWFENLVGAGGTVTVAQSFGQELTDGLLSDMWQFGLDFLLPQAPNNQQVLELFMRTDGGISNYQGLLVSLRRRMSHGLYFDVNYTLSRSRDQVGAVQNTAGYFPNPYDPNTDYGPSFFDRTHVFNATMYYELPFGRGHRFGSWNHTDRIFGGWYLTNIFTASSGLPLIVTQSDQTFGGGENFAFNTGSIPTVSPGSFGNSTHFGATGSNGIGTNSDPKKGGSGINLFADPAAAFNSFRRVLLSQDGRSGRGNPLRGFPKWNLDLSLGKRTNITERLNIVFHADFFNIFNHVDFNDPSLDLRRPSSFGVVTSQFVPPNRNAGSRWIQLGLNINF